MNGIRSGVTSSNPYESMKIAQRLIHSCEHRGVDITTQDLGGVFINSHQRCNSSILTYAENNGNRYFPLFFENQRFSGLFSPLLNCILFIDISFL